MNLSNTDEANTCRGEGCVLDLGRNHPMGSIGFVNFVWSDADRESFDRTGHPPAWAGKLHNMIPMVTIQDQPSQWRQNYTLVEDVPGKVAAYEDNNN